MFKLLLNFGSQIQRNIQIQLSHTAVIKTASQTCHKASTTCNARVFIHSKTFQNNNYNNIKSNEPSTALIHTSHTE